MIGLLKKLFFPHSYYEKRLEELKERLDTLDVVLASIQGEQRHIRERLQDSMRAIDGIVAMVYARAQPADRLNARMSIERLRRHILSMLEEASRE